MTFSLRKKFMYSFPIEYCHQETTSNITDINLEYNHFDKLPKTFENFSSLQILNLGHNSFIKIPRCITKLKNIEAIALHHNNITGLPSDFNWKKLKCINLSHNCYISYLPNSDKWHQIKYINCNRNRIVFLTKFYWSSLEILRMNHNFLHLLDDSLQHCINLRKLDMSHNKLRRVGGLTNLNNLLDINLSHNIIRKLDIQNLSQLETLNLGHNQLNINALQNIDWNSLTSLVTLDLSHNHIDNLDNIPWERLTELRVLKLDNNNLEHFPDITRLTNLVTLSISYNHISTVPNNINNLPNISLLDLSHNLLEQLPNTIGYMTELEELYIDFNRLVTVPNDLANCANLGFISYEGNPNIVIPQIVLNHLNRRIANNHNDVINTHQTKNNLKVYNDPQSVHNTFIQKDIRKVIAKLIEDNAVLDEEQIIVLVTNDDVLTSEAKEILINFCADTTTHCTTLNVNFSQILAAVWEKMLQLKPEYQTEVKKIISADMKVAESKCFTGKVSRLVGCLQGFIDGIEIGISEPEQINNIILMVKKKLEKEGNLTIDNWKNEFKKEMEERKYSTKTIDKYQQFIELDD